MTTQIKRRRGTTTEHSTFTGAEGELTIDTTKDTVVVHDGSTAGGHPLAKESSIAGKVDTSGDTMTGNLGFGDNDKAIFGAGSDLQIYHDGSASYVSDVGTGDLNVKGANVQIRASNNDTMAFFAENGEAKLFYDGGTKLATTSTGVDITGTLTSDGLTVDDGFVIVNDTTNDNQIRLESGNTYTAIHADPSNSVSSTSLQFKIDGSEAMRINNNGDISFYEDTGTTPKFFWDASAERLAVGGTTTNATLHVHGNSVISNGNFFSIQSSSGLSPELDEASNGWAFKTNGSERMRLDSSGNVGIKNSVMSSFEQIGGANLLVLGSGAGNQGMTIYSGNTGVGSIAFADGTTTTQEYEGLIQYSHNTNSLALYSNHAERMRITSSGNVGIGTSSPSAITDIYDPASVSSNDLLHVRDYLGGGSDKTRLIVKNGGNVGIGTSSPVSKLSIQSPSGQNALLEIAANGNTLGSTSALYGQDAVGNAYAWQRLNGPLLFGTNNSERMRIDSSGFFLVGTTTSDSANVGHGFNPNGFIYHTRDAGVVLRLNRKTSDGTILDLRKDGSTVGSIGTSSSRLAIGTSNVGAFFASGNIGPWNTSTNTTRDNAIDLGSSSGRWKDLYLSGGVYLGGTGASNKLDDYEEGTHQITVTMSSSGTVTLNTSFDRFSYTKVGRLVTITGNPRISSVSSPVGNLQLTLPFTAVAGQTDECRAGGIMRYYDNSAGAGSYSRPIAWSIQEGASTLILDITNTNGNNPTPAASDEFYFSISYMTN